MKKCAVVIGVDRTGGLPILRAASDGAKQFTNWALSQGFEVDLLVDDNDRLVTLADIKKSVKAFVDKRIYSKLVVFFSGHGILKAPDTELWLLSDAPDDTLEAVNVRGSISLSRGAGVPHVLFISDACRSLPDNSKLLQIQGGDIFPNATPRPPLPEVDVETIIEVWVNCPDEEVAATIADVIVSERLAAAANIYPSISSRYHWQDSIECAREIPLLFKTRQSLFEALAERVAELHPYETPSIIGNEVNYVNTAYRTWLISETVQCPPQALV